MQYFRQEQDKDNQIKSYDPVNEENNGFERINRLESIIVDYNNKKGKCFTNVQTQTNSTGDIVINKLYRE